VGLRTFAALILPDSWTGKTAAGFQRTIILSHIVQHKGFANLIITSTSEHVCLACNTDINTEEIM
jgi:hypothetical protein